MPTFRFISSEVPPPPSTYVDEVLADGPVWFYEFLETSGTSFADSSGNGHTAVSVASPTINQTGPLVGSKSIQFTGGVDQAIDTQYATNHTGNFTLEAFIRLTANQSDLIGAVISKNLNVDAGNNSNFPINLVLWGPTPGQNKIKLGLDSGNDSATDLALVYGTAISNTTWYHLAAKRTGSAVKIFLNGSQIASATYGTALSSNGNTWYIGSEHPFGANLTKLTFNGRIAYPALYSFALSDARIANHAACL